MFSDDQLELGLIQHRLSIGLFVCACLMLFVSPTVWAQSAPLTIVAPADGTVVSPGDTITVSVIVASGTRLLGVGIGIENYSFGPYDYKTVGPFDFQVVIRDDLIGPRKITAFGVTAPEEVTLAPPISIDVESTSLITALQVTPAIIDFRHACDQRTLIVNAKAADGSTLDLSRSSRTVYDSSNRAAVIVTSGGVVAGIGGGASTVTVSYGGAAKQVPVTVATGASIECQPSISSIAVTPMTIWPPDHRMVPVTVTVTASGGGSLLAFCSIAQINSNEPAIPGDSDWVITGPLSAELRAERAGNGTGRTYTLTVNCVNVLKQSTSGNVAVAVPHDQR